MSTTQGLDGLLRALDGLADEVLDGAALGLERGLAQTTALARELAPVQTGTLRDSIRHQVARDAGGVNGEVAAGAKYAADVEFGGPQPAKPFLYPAYKQTEASIGSAVQQGIKQKMGGG